MTYAQDTAWAGVTYNDVRPGVRARMGQQMLRIAKDQAALYESLTGIKVPLSTTISATPHVHDGTNGGIIPIPLFQVVLDGSFSPSTAALVRNESGWSAVARPIQWVPTGVTTVRCYVVVDTADTFSRLRVDTYDSTLALYDQGQDWEIFPLDGLLYGYVDMGVSGGEINQFVLRYRTAHPSHILPSVVDRVLTFCGKPHVAEGANPQPHIVQGANGLDVLVPTATQFDPANSGHHSSHEENFADDDPISGYMAHAAAYNEGQAFEILTGRPYPGLDTATWAGHIHGASATVAPTRSMGADMDQPLLAVNYGVRRTAVGKTDNRSDDDEAEGTLATMRGRIWSSQLTTATGTSYQALGSYPFLMPPALAANIHGTARLKFAVLCDASGLITSGTVRGTIANSSIASPGTSTTLTTSGTGLQLLSGAIDYTGSSDVGLTGERASLIIDAKRDSNYVATTGHTLAILSACLYYEDA